MAKKKKTTKCIGKAAPASRSPFWAYAGAVLLILSGIFVLLGGFGSGGTLPVTLFETAEAIFGLATYVLPVFLLYWGITTFASSDNRAPTKRLTSLFIAIMLLAAMFDITMAKDNGASQGGAVG